MNLTETLTIGAVVIAVVAALKDLIGDKMTGNLTRLAALLVGAGLGYLQIEGATIVTGALAGLIAVGTMTIVDRAKE